MIAATSDLFIQSRLRELASLTGNEILFSATSQNLADLASIHPGCLVILDLTDTDYDFIPLVMSLKQNKPPPQILAHYPHVRSDLETSAKTAGVDYVIPNSSFLKVTREILERRTTKR